MKKEPSVGGCIFLILYVPFLMIVAAVSHGYAASVLWGWFVAPMFHLPLLTITQALGLGLVVGLLSKDVDDSPKDDERELTEIVIASTIKIVLRPVFALAFGWVVRSFM